MEKGFTTPRPRKRELNTDSTLSPYFDRAVTHSDQQVFGFVMTSLESIRVLMVSEFKLIKEEMNVVRQDIKGLNASLLSVDKKID